MNKKILSGLLLVAIGAAFFFSCKKVNNNTTDPTLNYFPLILRQTNAHYVTYNVDSVYYYTAYDTIITDSFHVYAIGKKLEVKSMMKYVITDTVRNAKKELTYLLDVYTSPYPGGFWTPSSVIEVTEAPTTITNLLDPTTTSLNYIQDQTNYVKLIFPIVNGYTWQGNQNANINNTAFTYLQNWNYNYRNLGMSYFNNQVEFPNTVTVLEDSESVNYPGVDAGVAGYFTYAEEVYAYNVGMVYKKWTHYTWPANNDSLWTGYSVTMTAVDYNN